VGRWQSQTYARRDHAAQEETMKALMNLLTSIRRNDEGQDLLEYALLVALIAIVCVAAVSSAGNVVSATFSSIAGQI
jgi:pilus assembly protein Flp/PilA